MSRALAGALSPKWSLKFRVALGSVRAVRVAPFAFSHTVNDLSAFDDDADVLPARLVGLHKTNDFKRLLRMHHGRGATADNAQSDEKSQTENKCGMRNAECGINSGF